MSDVKRTLVITIDAHHLPDDAAWLVLKESINHAVDRVMRVYARDGAQMWRRSDDVALLLKEEGS